MKVLHIVGSLDKSAGGPSRSVPQTCQHLANPQLKIELIARPSQNPVKPKTSEHFKVRFCSLKQLIWLGLKLSKKDTDLIHLQHVWDPYIHVMAWFAQIKGIPYLITPRGMLEPWIMNRNPWKKKLAMLLYQRHDLMKAIAIHATCKMEKENIRKLGFSNPISVIPNGVDLSTIPKPKTKYRTKKIVFLSRIHEKKGIELLLNAWKQLKIADWNLAIAGEGESNYLKKLKTKIESENIKNVHFVGSQYGQNKWSFLKSGDIFVLPTYSENFGIVVAEALAVGIPVITTTGTPWQELETQKCGWWINLNVSNLVKVLTEAINVPPEELKKMGSRGIKLITEKYDIKTVAQQMKQIYQDIINK